MNRDTFPLGTTLADMLAADGFDPPPVTAFEELYISYVRFCHERKRRWVSPDAFVRRLAVEAMPVRLSDGQLGFVGLRLKHKIDWETMQ